MNILLVRHGETPWNREGRYQGRTDVPLSDHGLVQVRTLGERLASLAIDVAIASPLTRAVTTAKEVLRDRIVKLETDARLLEISHGGWEGKLASEVERDHAEMFGVWRSAPGRDAPAGPNAETLGDVEARAWPVIASLFEREASTALIVAHDAVNRVILCRVLGIPLEKVWKFRQSPAALNVLSGDAIDALQVVRLNDSDHSGPLLAESPHRAL